jgi:transposase
VDTLDIEKRARRRGPYRKHSDDFKRKVVAECLERGASVAGIALANGVNANLLRKWIPRYGDPQKLGERGGFVEVRLCDEPPPIPTLPQEPEGHIEVDLRGARLRLFGRVNADTLQLVLRTVGR